jgi:hypothetical protein
MLRPAIRVLITRAQPSLPQRAGKLYAHAYRYATELQKYLENHPPQDPTRRVRIPVGEGKPHVRVFPLPRPEVDAEEVGSGPARSG